MGDMVDTVTVNPHTPNVSFADVVHTKPSRSGSLDAPRPCQHN